jgi:glycosyltransferase involved in cell wall biosynthesis
LKEPFLVGCIPNSPDYSHPQDRRRYVPYFKKKDISFETSDYDKDYEIVYISLLADLNRWCNYKNKQLKKNKNVRIVFDLSDSYLATGYISDLLRSIYHYLSGRTTSFKLSYKKTILKMIENTDVITCSSHEQKNILDKLHGNVVVVRDYFYEDVTLTKSNYKLSAPKEFNILWEGFSHGNVETFTMLKNIVNNLNGFKVRIHLITDSVYCKIGTSFLCQPTYNILKKVFSQSDVSFHLYDWNTVTFSSIAVVCDFALIPIPNNPMMMQKPENKLLLLWFLGLPVIASKTPSYTRVMYEINEDYVCSTTEDWRKKIIDLASSQERRERYMESVDKYLKKYYSSDNIMETWDHIFFDH